MTMMIHHVQERMYVTIYYLASNRDGTLLTYSFTFPLSPVNEEKFTEARIIRTGFELCETDFSSLTTQAI